MFIVAHVAAMLGAKVDPVELHPFANQSPKTRPKATATEQVHMMAAAFGAKVPNRHANDNPLDDLE